MLIFSASGIAQPSRTFLTVNVWADHTDWTYKTGEKVVFHYNVTLNNNEVPNCKVSIQLGPEQMQPSRVMNKIINGHSSIEGGTMTKPGFLRCVVTTEYEGKIYRGLATAAFEPLKIQPTTQLPADFEKFWSEAKRQAAGIPADAKLTLLPDRCTEKVNVYQLNVQAYRSGSRVYGILSVPKKPGKYPALLILPGAGIRPYPGDVETAEKGIITLELGIHGVPVTMEPLVYHNLAGGALNAYPFMNLNNRDTYYYKRVYMACLRANDYLCSMPEYDGKQLAVYGGSQGGALAIVTAALDERVKCLVALYPALSDMTGYLYGRAGGWPHMFNKANAAIYARPENILTSQYYDVANFARFIRVPGFYSWGFNDETCPPTTAYATYNQIAAPKSLFLIRDSGHHLYPEQKTKLYAWLADKLLVKKE
ncbi:acetylxylan esterase [Pedobacter sp. SYP-B3415]|uniref:acetylxylan esterase n=1 Tax=Pedobacter sp. SYP-B3415 TaxID=2496641 RepID=UPI001F105D9F|nr:acetylxylan esterase [Pedobacter sp. SYP-B3415]